MGFVPARVFPVASFPGAPNLQSDTQPDIVPLIAGQAADRKL